MGKGCSARNESTKLPDTLAVALPPQIQEALDNRVRRQVLRVLNDSDQPLSSGEVAATLPDASVSAVSHHARVLDDLGSAHVVESEQTGVGIALRYASSVAGDPQVIAVLCAMQQDDA